MARDLKEKSNWRIAAPDAGADFVGEGTTRREALINLQSRLVDARTNAQFMLDLFNTTLGQVDEALQTEDGGSS